jgi:hypothetical protein
MVGSENAQYKPPHLLLKGEGREFGDNCSTNTLASVTSININVADV